MAINNVWQGKLIRMRGVEAEDWEFFYNWSHDTEIDQLVHNMVFPQAKAYVQKWTAELAAKNPAESDRFFWMIEDAAGEVAGTIATHNCDRRHGTFGYGLSIRREHWRKGYATEAIWLLLRFFFLELGYQKVNVNVYAFNESSLTLHRKLGFQEEGCRRRVIYTEGRYHDEYLFGMTREEFEGNANFNRG